MAYKPYSSQKSSSVPLIMLALLLVLLIGGLVALGSGADAPVQTTYEKTLDIPASNAGAAGAANAGASN